MLCFFFVQVEIMEINPSWAEQRSNPVQKSFKATMALRIIEHHQLSLIYSKAEKLAELKVQRMQ